MLSLISDKKIKNEPMFACWFGNFYEPYFSDLDKCYEGIDDLKKYGFNNIILDSKLWKDFTDFFNGEYPSQYVNTQLKIVDYCRKNEIGVSFLALYYIGDNLYPQVYDNPPEFIDQPVDLNGNKIRGYRHWSKKQQAKQIEHCINLHRKLAKDTSSKAIDQFGNERIPFYFYHDPIFTPCFDSDGINHYLNWLSKKYTIQQINDRYNISKKSISELSPQDYWVYPDKAGARWDIPKEKDYTEKNETILKYADNQEYKMSVLKDMFYDLSVGLKKIEPKFYLYSSISQWKIFFNDCQNAWFWDASRRNIDIWDAGKSLDCPSFTTLPADCYSQPDSYVVSCELAMLRSASNFEDFIAGLFLGRYIYNDIYNIFTPSEIISTAFGAGATDLYFYGYNGLDDGGNFGKLEEFKKQSVKEGLDFFTEIRTAAGKRVKTKKAAIIFPFATFALHHGGYNWQQYAMYRHDTLGWYKQFADIGINCDILHPNQIKEGKLAEYSIAINPANPLYWANKDTQMEKAVIEFIEKGGTFFHSAASEAHNFLRIDTEINENDSIVWDEKIATESSIYINFPNAEAIAHFRGNNKPAIICSRLGSGRIYSFGFDYGYAYSCNIHLPSPAKYGKENHYPMTLLEKTPVEKIMSDEFNFLNRHRNIEKIVFENGVLVINHSSYPYKLQINESPEILSNTVIANNILSGHNSVFILNKNKRVD